MANLSKLFGSLLGSLVGIAGALGMEAAWATPELINALALLIATGLGTYLAPANRS